MTKLQQLRARRDAKAKEANELNNKYPADQRMPKDQIEKLEAILNEVEAIDDEISRERRVVDLAGADPQAQQDALRNEHTRTPGAHQGNPAEAAALRAYLTGGFRALTPEQVSMVRARQNPQNAMSTTTDSEGGYAVATEYYTQLEIALKAYGGMRQAGTIIRTGSGAPMNFPTADATAEVGEIVGQNVTATVAGTTFGNTTLEVQRFSSKSIGLPFELVQDSFLDIEAYVRDLLAMRIGRIQNTYFTTGDGVAKPWGIVTSAAAGKVGTTGQTATVIYADLVDLEHSVDPAYRGMPGVGYMMNDASVKVIRKIVDGQSRPMFVPGYESSNPGSAPDRLMGRPIIVNQDIATMAANAKSILFGCFKKYLIRDVMDLMLFRMTDSAYTLLGQVGFVGFMRSGGRLIDVGGASVKYYQNSAS